MTASHVEFTPSAANTLPTTQLSTVVPLPTPDPANTAVVLRNLSHATVLLRPGATAVREDLPGAIILQANETKLVVGGPLATVATVAIMAMPGAPITDEGELRAGLSAGTGVRFTRGSTKDVWMFRKPAEAVI